MENEVARGGLRRRRCSLRIRLNIPYMRPVKSTFALLLFLFVLALPAVAQLPVVTLRDVDGRTVRTDTLGGGGRPLIVSFFATWCKPCLRELAAIHEVYADWQAETGVRLVAVSIDEAQNAQRVKPLVDAAGWEWDVLLDPNGELRRAMGVQSVPHVFVVDGAGRVVLSRTGYVEGGEEEIIESLQPLP